MLGLGLGIDKTSTTNDVDTWEEVPGRIAHYDFSDASTLFQNDDGSTAVSSDNDPIGYAKNLTPGGLGGFIRSYSDAGRPLYKTGGTNSKSYAQFDGSNDCGLVAGVVAISEAVWGGISDSIYSNYTLEFESISLYVVCKQDVENITSTETLIKINGQGDAPGIGDNNFLTLSKPSSTDVPSAAFSYGTDPAITTINNASAWGTEDRLMTVITANGTNATKLQVDNLTATTGTIAENEPLNMTSTANAGRVMFSVGAMVYAFLNPNSQNWQGRVYEILLYNRSLSSAEDTLVKNYINTKYALW
jgi:hypothetical protein